MATWRQSAFGCVVLLACMAQARAAPLHLAPFKQIDLSAAMHLPPGWVLRAEQPAGGGEDASSDKMPARICFDGPSIQNKTCTDLNWTASGIGQMVYPLQTIDDIAVASIPDGHGGQRPAVLVRASYSGGSIHGIHALLIWRYEGVSGFGLGPETHSVATGGTQRFFTDGPLAGLFVQISPEWISGTYVDPEHVRIDVARVTDTGSYTILSVLSPDTYPTPAADGPPPDLLDKLTPWIVQTLHATYPKGLP